jgi:putative phage-type endonuclease
MIAISRFLTPSSAYEEWKRVRRTGVTATQVSKAATPKGFEDELRKMVTPEEIEDNAYMKFGRDNEQWIVLSLKDQYEVLPNEWLIAARDYPWQMATPDGLSLDHKTIAEVKTTGTDWGDYNKVPIHYRRQVQWQLHVTDAEQCVFAWVLRHQNKHGQYVPAWFEPKTVLVDRDPKMITDLIDVANRLHNHQN